MASNQEVLVCMDTLMAMAMVMVMAIQMPMVMDIILQVKRKEDCWQDFLTTNRRVNTIAFNQKFI
jgi:hypothetical protein